MQTRQFAARFQLVPLLSCFAVFSCSADNGSQPGSEGGKPSTGGTQSVSTGGTSSPTTGGTVSTGGAPATGGTVSTGGNSTTGGVLSTGGAVSTGGTSMGGSGGSGVTTGGKSGNPGGATSGGMTDTGGKYSGAGAGGKATGGAAGAASGGTAGASGGAVSGGASGSGGAGTPTLPPVTDYTAKGPFTTKQENNVGPGGKYTVYRPEPLGKDGFVHAPIVFGPGIGQQVTVHTQMLTNFASHGFIVVGTPVLNGGPGDAANLKSMKDGLDWIVQQNAAQGTYLGKVWVDHAISMGFSVGGTSAVQLGGEAPVATVVSIHGHNANAALHGPMLQTTGTKDTVGMPLQQQTYEKSMVQTFLGTLTGAPHPYIESNGGGDERPAILAWMRYWIYKDEGAKKYFYGTDCVMCKAPWENPQRKNWQ